MRAPWEPRSSRTTSSRWTSLTVPSPHRGDSGTTYTADAVILATGAQAKWLGLPTEETFKGFGVSACATCDGFFYRGQEVVVVGGGNTAVEEALFLTNFASKVTLIHRRDELQRRENPAAPPVQSRQRSRCFGTTIWTRSLGEDNPKGVEGVRVKHTKTGAVTEIPCKGVFIAIGHAPSNELVKDTLGAAFRRLCGDGTRFDGHLDPRASSPLVTSPTTSIVRRSPRPAWAAWRHWKPRSFWQNRVWTPISRRSEAAASVGLG